MVSAHVFRNLYYIWHDPTALTERDWGLVSDKNRAQLFEGRLALTRG